MRPADRLFQIVLALSRGKVLTARALGERFGVSERTIYRDINDLAASGVPIEGEAGVGYRLRRDYQVPPLMFDNEELQALAFGVQVAQAHGDPALATAAERVLAKLDAALPPRLRAGLEGGALHVPGANRFSEASATLGELRCAVNERQRVFIDYVARDEAATQRIVWPLTLAYWGVSWTLGGWCELREGFRNFRVDRIRRADVLKSQFPDAPGRRLNDYLRSVDVAP
ncbi:MAG: YafY family protein [Pseudomonadota bacterium]